MANDSVDFDHYVFHIVSMIRTKAEIAIDDSKTDPQILEGMRLAYSFIISDIKLISKNFGIPLSKVGLEDFDENKLLSK
jgi:hypothetical protein